MNKAQLIDEVQKALGEDCTRSYAERALNSVLESISRGLKTDTSVQLTGFGTFQVKSRAARTVRNPQTKEPMQVPASKTVGFKPGQALKDAVA
ncbi:MAG: HU family DNA-binding protein [Planctomycetota bacterium]